MIVDNRDDPSISIQYCLAVAAFDGQLTWDQFTPERLKDKKVVNLKSKVLTIPDPRLDERQKITKSKPAEVEVEMKDGHLFSERVDSPRGGPGNPPTEEDVDRKVMQYASKVIGQNKTRSFIEVVKSLETVDDLNRVGDLLRI